MRTLKALIITCIFIWIPGQIAYCQCKSIRAEAKVSNTSGGADNGVITLELDGGLNKNDFTISLFAPDKKNRLQVSEFVFDNLKKGKYLVVVSAKHERDNFCPKSINVTIN